MTSVATHTKNAPALLEVHHLGKTFHEEGTAHDVLNDVSFHVEAGEVVGLIGPDGAGKTTLMRLLVGLLRPDRGAPYIQERNIAEDPLRSQRILSYMPQRFGLYQELTVQENLDVFADLYGIAPEARPDRYAELMRMTGLGSFPSRQAGHLSGGMQQKLGIACALLPSPELLLLDEPTVGVDPLSRRELWSIVYRQVHDRGTAVLVSTAYLDEADRCDRVVLLHQGRVLGIGRPGDFTSPLEGRVFFLESQSAFKRHLHRHLTDDPDVLDAVIQGDGVRAVTQTPSTEVIQSRLPGAWAVTVHPLPARFEDSFMDALLREGGPAEKPKMTLSAPTAPHQEGPIIRARRLWKRFGRFDAVKDLDFAVYPGEVFGLLGANGAGKSTTFRMLCGLLPPTAGELTVHGHDVRRRASRVRSHLGYMAQKFSLYGDLSVRENLQFFGSAYGLRGERQRSRIKWAMRELGLTAYRRTASRNLPLGFKQRLALAVALLHEPPLLFLDEPTSGVDPLFRREFWRHIQALAEQGITVLVTTHFLEEAEYCDRLLLMAEGSILAEGSPRSLRERAASAEHPHPDMEEAFVTLIQQTSSDPERSAKN